MVVRGWYMPHFDRTDLLVFRKQVWGGFRYLPDLTGPICENFRFFRKFRSGRLIVKNRFFLLSSPKILFKNNFFTSFVVFPENMVLQLHFGIFTLGVLPVD